MENEKEIRDKFRRITKLLIEKHLTITVMESCTAGMVASLLTDTEGSSEVFFGSFVTYSNEAKVMNGVPAGIIEDYGVYSNETACAMAEAAGKAYGSDIAIGVTGTMGNVDPANNDSKPGEVFFAIFVRGSVTARRVLIEPQDSRHDYKLCVAGCIGDELLDILEKS